MDKSPLKPNGQAIRSGTAQINYQSQHFSIPPPHAHSLISKRDGSSLLLNTEIKVQDRATPESTYTAATETINNSKIADTHVISHQSEHEIKFTKTEGCTPSTCICVFIAILLISIGASSGIYYGLRSYEGTLLKDQVFKGQFTVTRGDSYHPKYEKRSSDEFKEAAKLYKERLDALYVDSRLSKAFRRSEIIALEKTPKPGSDDLVVHFNLVFSPLSRPSLSSVDAYMVLGEEVGSIRKKSMKNITIDPNSIDIQERKSEGIRRGLFYTTSSSFPASAQFLENPNPWESRTQFPGLLEGLSTEATPPPRRCGRIGLPFCSILPYKSTSYPNIAGHWNLSSLEEDFVSFRQIVDAECYPLAREFICRLVQPECEDDMMIWPCRDFCEDFHRSCEAWIPKKLSAKLKCKRFPSKDGVADENEEEENEDSYENSGSYELLTMGRNRKKRYRRCRPKPGCINELRMRNQNHLICDSIVDCHDGSDEFACDYCSTGHKKGSADSQDSDGFFFCGNSQCIEPRKRCDAIVDCNNGIDEKGCFALSSASSVEEMNLSALRGKDGGHFYQQDGILFSLFAGRPHKVCAYNFLNSTIPLIRKSSALQAMASTACKQLGFKDSIKAEPRSDATQSFPYVEVISIKGDIISVQETECTSRQTVHIHCTNLECGFNPLFNPPEKRIDPDNVRTISDPDDPKDGDNGLYRALSGDWPWQAFLTKNSDYSCDASLIDSEWALTSSNCFEENGPVSFGGPNSKWKIGLGSVRLIMKSPLYGEERFITALMNSSASDQLNLTLVRLNKPVNFSDFVRPICLPGPEESAFRKLSNADCYSTFWDVKKDRLLFARATVVDSSECINFNDDFIDRKRDNHWCVKLTRSESENRLDKINGCPGCGQPGRPLYCSFSHSSPRWFLLGIESSSNAAERHHRQRSAKTTYWYSKVSLASDWVHKVMNSFKQTISEQNL